MQLGVGQCGCSCVVLRVIRVLKRTRHENDEMQQENGDDLPKRSPEIVTNFEGTISQRWYLRNLHGDCNCKIEVPSLWRWFKKWGTISGRLYLYLSSVISGRWYLNFSSTTSGEMVPQFFKYNLWGDGTSIFQVQSLGTYNGRWYLIFSSTISGGDGT